MTNLLTIAQAAKLLGISEKTLRRWEASGILVPQRTNGNQRRYDPATLTKFTKSASPPTLKFSGKFEPLPNVQVLSDVQVSTLNVQPLKLWFLSVLVILLTSSILITPTALATSWYESGKILLTLITSKNANPNLADQKLDNSKNIPGNILGAETTLNDFVFNINVPSNFNQAAKFNAGIQVAGDLIAEDITATNIAVENFTAPNVIYSITAGQGITITTGQTPTISATAQNAFTNVKVGTSTATAGSATDTLTFAAGDGIALGINTSDKKITITNDIDLDETGWHDNGDVVRLASTDNRIGIGTATGSAKLAIEAGAGDLLTASASGVTRFKIGYDGNLAIKGVDYSFPTSQGSASTILQNDGSGNLTWTTVTASGITGDSLDFTEFKDSLTLDSTTTIANAGYNLTLSGVGTTIISTPLTLSGNLTFSGGVAQDSDLVPVGTTGTNDLGSSSIPWDNIYVTAITQNGTTLDNTYAPINSNFITVTSNGTLTGETGIDNLTTAISTTSTITASGAIAANGGITFDAATDTVGAHTLSGTIDANANIITNIGNAGTDFDTSGGLTLADDLTVTGGDIIGSGTFNVANAATTLNLGSTNVTRTINLGTGTNADTINIGTGGTTADIITIGSTLASTALALNDDNWNITGGGAANFASIGAVTPGSGAFTTLSASGAIAANGGITFDSAADTVGAHTLSGTIDANANIITNIGNAGTDFDTSGGLTLADDLTVTGADIITGATGIASVFNTNATTLNIGGAATTISLGAGSGTTTVNNGLTITGTLTANGIANIGDGGDAITLNGTAITGVVSDNITNALDIQEGSGVGGNNYININTTNASENISFGNASTNPTFTFLGTGTSTFTGAITQSGTVAFSTGTGAVSLNGDTTVANGKTFIANGSFTLGDGGDTGSINSSGWGIDTSGNMTGIGSITMDGNFSQTGATTFGTGTGAISLNGDITLASGKILDSAGALSFNTTNNQAITTGTGLFTTGGGLTVNGNTTLGDAITDTLTFTGRVAQDSDLLPITTTGTNDLGSSSLPWDNLYVTATTGDVFYASGTNTVGKLGIGSAGQVLVVSGGVPTWNTIGGATCTVCVVTNPSSTQTITPTASTVTGLSIAQASSGSVDIFNVTSNGGGTEYLAVDSTGKTVVTGFQLTTSPGNGYALVSDGSGNGSWTNLATNGTAGPWTLSGSTLYPDEITNDVLVGSITTTDAHGKFTVSGTKVGKALAIFNDTGTDQNILVASASGTTVMTLGRTGNLSLTDSGSSNIDFNLTSTGDFTISDGGTPYATFTDTGVFILDSLNLDGTTIGLTTDTDLLSLATNALTVNGAVTATGAIAANGGITFDAVTDTVGAHTLSGTIDANANIITNIGNTGTDFDASGGLTLAGTLTANGIANIGDGGDAITLNGTAITGVVSDNITNALDIQEGSGVGGNNYININTTNASENISFGNASTNPTFTFLGTGTSTFTGAITQSGTVAFSTGTGAVSLNGDTTVASGKTLIITGSADGTDALTLTTGDILVSNGDLDLSGGDLNVTLDASDEIDVTKSATAASTEEGIDLTFTSGAGDGSDIYSGIRIAATSANHSASTDKLYGLNIANLSSADTEGDESAIFVGTGWDSLLSYNGTTIINSTGGVVGGQITADSLDFTEFQDTLDLDAALILNQTTNTWGQTFTGDTTTGLTYTASSLTSGKAALFTTAATAFTGNLVDITSTGGNAANTGTLLHVQSAASNAETTAMFTNLGTGLSFRVNDETGDSDASPFVIDSAGSVGIRTSAPDAALEINHATGDSLRLTYNDSDGSATNYTDFSLSSTGALTLTGSAATLGASATAEKTFLTLTPGTITLTAPTQVTSLMETSIFTGATIAADAATTVDKATTLSLVAPVDSTNTTLTDNSALRILNVTSGAGTLTNQYGIYVDSLTAGATGDYGIYVAGADSYSLYAAAGDVASLDDLFVGATSETITHSSFALDGDDAFISGLLGVEGDIYTDGDIDLAGGDLTTANTTATLFNTNATTLSLGGAATTALNLGNGSGNYTAINVGSGAGTHTINIAGTGATAADIINIGTGGTTADTINVGSSAGATAFNVTTGTGVQLFTSNVVTGTTTTSGFVFDATALTTGTGAYFTADALTTGKLVQIATTGNTFTTGTLLDIASTSTALTSGKFLNISNGSDIFTISNTDMTSALPANFTAPGDVAVAYDLNFTNQTASYIKSSAPLYLEAGESFESNDLTLKVYNAGGVIIDGLNSVNTSTTGVFDLNVASTTTSNVGLNVDYTSNSGVTAAADLFAAKINLNQADTDGDLFGLWIENAATSVTIAGTNLVDCLLCLNNAENQAAAVLNGIYIASSGSTAGAITNGINIATTDVTTDLVMQNGETLDNNTDGTVNLNGLLQVDLGTSSDEAICGEDGDGDQTDVTLRDCSGSPVADYAEIYPTANDVEFGDIVVPGAKIVYTKGLNAQQNVDDSAPLEPVSELIKSTSMYQNSVIGIASNNYGDFSSTGHNRIDSQDHPLPIALSGRVQVKISPNSQAIQAGDFLTTSTDPGQAMKAQRAGMMIGKALEAWDPASGKNTVLVFVNNTWADPNMALAFDDNGNLKVDGTVTAKEVVAENLPTTPTINLTDLNTQIDSLKTDMTFLTNQLATLVAQNPSSSASGTMNLNTLGDATISGTLAVLGNSLFNNVDIIGNLKIGLLSFDGLNSTISSLTNKVSVTGELAADVVSAKEIKVLGTSAGKATIAASDSATIIYNALVASTSAIFATPIDNAIPVAVKDIKPGEFTIITSTPPGQDLQVNWWIVN